MHTKAVIAVLMVESFVGTLFRDCHCMLVWHIGAMIRLERERPGHDGPLPRLDPLWSTCDSPVAARDRGALGHVGAVGTDTAVSGA